MLAALTHAVRKKDVSAAPFLVFPIAATVSWMTVDELLALLLSDTVLK